MTLRRIHSNYEKHGRKNKGKERLIAGNATEVVHLAS